MKFTKVEITIKNDLTHKEISHYKCVGGNYKQFRSFMEFQYKEL